MSQRECVLGSKVCMLHSTKRRFNTSSTNHLGRITNGRLGVGI